MLYTQEVEVWMDQVNLIVEGPESSVFISSLKFRVAKLFLSKKIKLIRYLFVKIVDRIKEEKKIQSKLILHKQPALAHYSF